MENNEKFTQWKETQEHWDDTQFLLKEANALMRRRWERLNLMAVKTTGEEVVKRNEYVHFLDIGCGRGDFYRHVSEMVKKYRGIEPSSGMLKDEINDEELVITRGTGEDFEEKSGYDVCLIKEVLDHTYDPEKVIKNAYEALREGGLIIITLTNRESYYKLIFRKKAAELEKKHADHLHNFTHRDITGMLEKAGFKVESDISYNYLRLPRFMEEAIGRLPAGIVFGILDFSDALLSRLMPKRGGSLYITARKGAVPGGLG